MKRIALNLISLVIAAVQASACFFAILLLWKSAEDPREINSIIAYIFTGVALVVNFFMTKLDSHVRGYAYKGKLIFWISFAVGYLRVFVMPFVIIGIVISFFTGNDRFAEPSGAASDYPISCLVYVISSIDYMTESARADSNRRYRDFEERRKRQEEEDRIRREERRERIKNLPHDTNRHGFCTTRYLPIGYYTTAYGGTRGVRVVSERAYMADGTRPTVEITVRAPLSSDDKSSYDVDASARRWVEREFRRYYCNYTNNYKSCVPIENVRLIIHVTR